MLSESLLNDIVIVLDIFASGRAPNDDTLIEKLLSWIRKELSDIDSFVHFVRYANFHKYVSKLVTSSDVDVNPQVWAFVVRLCIHINVHMVTPSPTLVLGSELQEVLYEISENDSLWAEATIRCVWLDGLLSLVNCLEFNLRILSYFEYSLQKILDCTTDNSWFVCRTAISLVAKLVNHFCGDSSQVVQEGTPPHTSLPDDSPRTLKNVIQTDLKEFIFRSLVPLAPTSDCTIRLTVSLEIIEKIYSDRLYKRGNGEDECVWCPVSIASKLCRLMEGEVGNCFTDILRVLSALWRQEDYCSEIILVLEGVLYSLFRQRRIREVVQLSSWLMTARCNGDVERYEFVCMMPLIAAVGTKREWNTHFRTFKHTAKGHKLGSFSNSQIRSVFECNHQVEALKLSLERLSQTECFSSVTPILSYVTRLVELTLTSSLSSSRGYQVANSARVKACCLDVCLALVPRCCTMKLSTLCTLGSVLVKLMLEIKIDQATMSKSLAVIMQILKQTNKLDYEKNDASLDSAHVLAPRADQGTKNSAGKLLESLSSVLERAVCSQLWDVRDAAVEFLGKVFHQFGDRDAVVQWVRDAGLHKLVWTCVNDGESYVRASSLKSLSHITDRLVLWNDLIVHVQECDIRAKVFDIGRHDPEAFARRAAVDLVIRWHSREELSTSHASSAVALLSAAAQDLDWEVKRLAVAFWHAYAIRCLSAKGRLGPQFPDAGCEALWCLSRDFDRSVQERALSALIDLKKRDTSEGGGLSTSACIVEPCQSQMGQGSESLISIGQGQHGLATSACFPDQCQNQVGQREESLISIGQGQQCNDVGQSEACEDIGHDPPTHGDVKEEKMNVDVITEVLAQDKFYRLLSDTDLASLHAEASRSTDEYEDNPASLLSDIIKSCPSHRPTAIVEMDDDEDLVPVVDCY